MNFISSHWYILFLPMVKILKPFFLVRNIILDLLSQLLGPDILKENMVYRSKIIYDKTGTILSLIQLKQDKCIAK